MTKKIKQIFKEFLAEQELKLCKRNFAYCQDAVGLFEACLNSYGHLGLEEDQYEILEKSKEAEFCELFVPEILDYTQFSEYVGYFLPKKVMSGYYTLNKYKIQILRLMDWLYEHKYSFQDESDIKAIKAELKDNFKSWYQECNNNKKFND